MRIRVKSEVLSNHYLKLLFERNEKIKIIVFSYPLFMLTNLWQFIFRSEKYFLHIELGEFFFFSAAKQKLRYLIDLSPFRCNFANIILYFVFPFK